MRKAKAAGFHRRHIYLLASLLAFQSLIAGCGEAETATAGNDGPMPPAEAARKADGRTEGVWQPPNGFKQTPIWPGKAPNMEGITLPPEYSETKTNPKRFAGHRRL